MANALYRLIIYPLYEVIEFTFMLVYQVFKDGGAAVIGVSIAVSLLCLPLYIVAEGWSKKEREKVASMARGVSRIKSTFRGDEGYMILSTFYRQNDYTPLMQLRSSFGLLIQIPFFIAAYNFLSHCQLLEGQTFLFIRNLSTPDMLFFVAGIPINILPIAMTVINIIAGAIYTKGFQLKEKLPIYIMALIFLVILYDSPAALVLYWTMNNLFSLIKNIFYKLKKPLRVLYILTVVVVLLLDGYLLFIRSGFFGKRLLLAAVLSLVLLAPLVVKGCRALLNCALNPLVVDKKARNTLFFLSSGALFLFFGAVIPFLTVHSSVVEFCGVDGLATPFSLLGDVLLQAGGIFLVWAFCIYFLFGARVETLLSLFMLGALFTFIVNSFIFSGDYATLSRVLTFAAPVGAPALGLIILNLIVDLFFFFLPIILLRFKGLCQSIAAVALLGCAAVSISSGVGIFFESKGYQDKIFQNGLAENTSNQTQSDLTNEESLTTSIDHTPSLNIDKSAIYHLSKTGENVILIMLDRAEGGYLLDVLEEQKEIKKSFRGFTNYSNCVSYNQGTLLAAPALFGGYEYTPRQMNKRGSERLVDKHNEALLLLPRIFSEQADFFATVTDLSWANYSWIPDMSICRGYDKIKGLNIEGHYLNDWLKAHPGAVKDNLTSTLIKRNFLWFSLFRASPIVFREAIYHDGTYWGSDDETNDVIEFLGYYSTLSYLPKITLFDATKNQYITLVNDTTHSGASIKKALPDIKTSLDYKNIGGFIAALKALGEWLDYLDANGCYDNTRILITSDHGMGSSDGEELSFFGKKGDFLGDYNGDHNHPLLLFKDFNERGDLTTNESFMTSADVPLLLTKGVIPLARNPFTGNILSDCVTYDSDGEKIARGVVLTHNWSPNSNKTNTFTVPSRDWVDVKHDLRDYGNWTQ